MTDESEQQPSPVRRALRRGVVYGVAGVLTAADAVASAARGVASVPRGVSSPESDRAGQTGEAMAAGSEGGGQAVGVALRRGAVYGLAKMIVAGRGVRRAADGIIRDATERAKGDQAVAMPASASVAETAEIADVPAPEVRARDD